MPIFLYTIGVLAFTIGLAFFSYLDRRIPRVRARVDGPHSPSTSKTFEAEIEPRFKMERRRAAMIFSLLARLWLVLVAAVTARGVIFFVPGTWEAAIEMVFFLSAEVVIAMQFWPSVLLAALRGTGSRRLSRSCGCSSGWSGRFSWCSNFWCPCCTSPKKKLVTAEAGRPAGH